MCNKIYNSIKMLVFFIKMKVCTCFLLFTIFAYANSSPLHSPKEYKRDINLDLDLEGALEFKVDKNSVLVSDNQLTGYKKHPRRDSRPPRVETFTGFIQEVIKILYTYDDNTFEDCFQILDKEIRKYHDRGFIIHDLTEDFEIRNLLEEKFDFNKGKSIFEVAEIIKHKINVNNVKQLLNYINSLYKEDARERFRQVLTDLRVYGNSNIKEPKNDLDKIIRNGLRAIIFNHYTNLDGKEKRGLKKEIVLFLKGLTEVPSARSKADFIPSKPAVSELNTRIFKTVTTKVKKPDILIKSDPTSSTVKNKAENKKRKFHRKKTSDELSENDETIITTSEVKSDSKQLVLASTDEIYHESTEVYSRETSTDESSDETVQKSSLDLSQKPHRKLNALPYETLYIEDFYKTTKKTKTIYESKMKSKVEAMSIEDSTDRLPTARPNTKRLRHRTTPHSDRAQTKKVVSRRSRPSQTTSRFLSIDDNDNLGDKDFRRSIAPPMPNEELPAEVFDKEKRRREEALAQSYSFISNNSYQHGLKDYIKRRRHLDSVINELKKIQEYNHLSTVNRTNYNVDKINYTMYKNTSKPIEGKHSKETNVVSESQSNKYQARAQTEENESKERDNHDGINATNLFNKEEQEHKYKKEPGTRQDKNAIKLKKQKKDEKSGSKKSTKTQTTGTRYKYSTKEMKTPSKLYTTILDSITIPVFLELQPTAKENKNLTETTSKATIEVDNATLIVNKEIITKKNTTTVDIDEDTRGKLNLYVVVTPSTRRHRRFLQYSSTPFY